VEERRSGGVRGCEADGGSRKRGGADRGREAGVGDGAEAMLQVRRGETCCGRVRAAAGETGVLCLWIIGASGGGVS